MHFKATVLLLPSGTVRITGLPPFAEGTVKSEKEVGGVVADRDPGHPLSRHRYSQWWL